MCGEGVDCFRAAAGPSEEGELGLLLRVFPKPTLVLGVLLLELPVFACGNCSVWWLGGFKAVIPPLSWLKTELCVNEGFFPLL